MDSRHGALHDMIAYCDLRVRSDSWILIREGPSDCADHLILMPLFINSRSKMRTVGLVPVEIPALLPRIV